MKLFNFLIIPYRDQYFLNKYGPVVRDLQIIDALERSESVSKITVLNRPVSIYERLLGLKPPPKHSNTGKTRWLDLTSAELIGPLRRRSWLTDCYSNHYALPFLRETREPDLINVVLDFTPLSAIDYESLSYDLIWYDLIDNFSKHNRFSSKQKQIAAQKYRRIRDQAHYITGVSPGAVTAIGHGLVVPNGISGALPVSSGNARYDFGFLGFITDKFDIPSIAKIASWGYSVGIYGDSYDKAVTAKLQKIPGVFLHGKFSQEQVHQILGTFKVGLIPYLRDRLHDESPLKLYQYLAAGRPVLASTSYEISSPFVAIYENELTLQHCKNLIDLSQLSDTPEEVRKLVRPEHSWTSKLHSIFSDLRRLHHCHS